MPVGNTALRIGKGGLGRPGGNGLFGNPEEPTMPYAAGKRLYQSLYATYSQWVRDDCPQHAAAISYYAALSIFPLVIVLLSLGGAVLQATGWAQDARPELLGLIGRQTAPELTDQLAVVIQSARAGAATSGPIGFALLVLAAMAVFAQLERAFDRIWNLPPSESKGLIATVRNILVERLRAFLMLLGIGLFVAVSFLGGMALTMAQAVLTRLPLPPLSWNLATVAVAVAVNWLLLAVTYRVLPKAPVKWSEAAGGAFLAAALWEVGHRVLAVVALGSEYGVYGVVGAFIAVMLWVYYAAGVVLLGAEYVRVACRRGAGPSETQQSRAAHPADG